MCGAELQLIENNTLTAMPLQKLRLKGVVVGYAEVSDLDLGGQFIERGCDLLGLAKRVGSVQQ